MQEDRPDAEPREPVDVLQSVDAGKPLAILGGLTAMLWLLWPGALAGLLVPSTGDLLLGGLAGLPLLLVAYVSLDLNTLVMRTLSPWVAAMPLWRAATIAVAAAILEELLFRGLLPAWGVRLGFSPMTALVVANVLFAAGYAATRQYGIVAFFIGCYFSALSLSGSTPNLSRAIVAHLVFNLVVFLVADRHARRVTEENPIVATGVPAPDSAELPSTAEPSPTS